MKDFLAEVPTSEVDNAFRALVCVGVPVDHLDGIIVHANVSRSDYYRAAVTCIVYDILRAIREGVIARWDFDVADMTHLQKNRQNKTKLLFVWDPPADWRDHEKRAVLYGIIGCYRSICHSIVGDLVSRFNKENTLDGIRALKEEALDGSILINSESHLQNNNSIVDSKMVLLAYQAAVSRLKRRLGKGIWPIVEAKLEREFYNFAQ